MKTITYLYDDYLTALKVMRELESSGVTPHNIALVGSNADGRYKLNGTTVSDESNMAANGAAVGGVVGIGAGVLTALGALAIPGLGPLVAAGVLATTIVTTTGGVIAGSLIGGLIEYGISEPDAHVYAEGVRRGGTLISTRVSDEQTNAVDAIMRQHGGVHADERRKTYTEGGWSTFDNEAPVYNPKEIERERARVQL